MYLEKLEMQGFKSFANKTTLTFKKRGKENPGITAVVGPNGSGKSNIADAVRWVLGEQSLKLLRGKKSEDVIFSGSNTKTRLNFAEVSLFLNNEDRLTDIEYAHVVVARRVYRDGSSEYRLNNNKVRLSDIQLLLAQANFGQRTYSVIGQGMADSILSATPQERKNFFDEATGVKQYQIKREQSLHKIETTEQNLSEAQGVLREISPRVKTLEKQIERLKKRGALEKDLHDLHLRHFGTCMFAITEELEQAREAKKHVAYAQLELTKKLTGLQGTLEDLAKTQTKEASGEYEILQKEHLSLLQKKQELIGRLSALEREHALVMEREKETPHHIDTKALIHAGKDFLLFLDSLETAPDASTIETIKPIARALRKKLNDMLHASPKKSPETEARLKQLEQRVTQHKTEKTAIEHTLAEKENALSKIRTQQTKATTGVFVIQKQYQTLQTELNAITEKRGNIDIQLARAETKREDLDATIKRDVAHALHQKITHYTPRKNEPHADLWPQIARIKHELEMIGGIDASVADEYAETKKRFDFLSTQVADLESALEKTKHALEELDAIIDREFNKAFATIAQGFNEYFGILFNGGSAKIQLFKETELERLTEEVAEELTKDEREALSRSIKMGVEITASPPNKKVSTISMLSGGERALTSIALISAIIHANPSPFVVLDEMDAALDEANSVRFAEILERLSHETQCITITHNRATMEKGNTIYGVTMGKDGVSKLLSVDLEKAMQAVDAHGATA